MVFSPQGVFRPLSKVGECWMGSSDRFVSKSGDALVFMLHALVTWWDQFNPILTVPALKHLPRLLCRTRWKASLVILLSPNWPRQLWYLDLIKLSWIMCGHSQIALISISGPPHCLLVTNFNCLVVESQFLKQRGLSDSVTFTLSKARKKTFFCKVYH